MNGVLLGFGLGGIILALGTFSYIRRVNRRMRRFVLRFEEIKNRVE